MIGCSGLLPVLPFSIFFHLPNSQLVIKILLLVNCWHCQMHLLMSTFFCGIFFFPFVFQKLTSLVKVVCWFLLVPILSFVEALMSFLWSRGNKQGPLFLEENYSPLTKSKFFNRLKFLLKVVGFDCNYTLYSFRVGAATTAAALGFPEYLLKALGRWSSDAYKVYVKLPFQCLALASKTLGQFLL